MNIFPHADRLRYDTAGSAKAMAEAGVTPLEINIYELHDYFSTNKLILLMRLSLRLQEGLRVNSSGDLISKGYPLGTTGLAKGTPLT
jgi:acetyl-CoA acetyltransferase